MAVHVPRIISVDDHVVEPSDLWLRHLPERLRDAGPRMERAKGVVSYNGRHYTFDDDPDGEWADRWVYEDDTMPITAGFVAACFERETLADNHAVIIDDLDASCVDPAARVAGMDANHVEASMCFPTFPRFCGQTFLEGRDRSLGLACVRAYNDWMIDEWCAEAPGRLIPLTLIPLWAADLAADEVRRCADKGSHAISFSENPAVLGLPSIHSGYWDPVFAACEETDTVVNMHIGSSSYFPRTSDDAPKLTLMALTFQGATHALVDWLCSGLLDRFPGLRIVLSEGQVGWMPFILERLDKTWEERRLYGGVADLVPEPPSSYMDGRVFGCIFDDQTGLAMRDRIGMSQIMIETDYPHGDSTWPHSRETIEKIVTEAGLDQDEVDALVRGNAIRCYNLDQYFGVQP